MVAVGASGRPLRLFASLLDYPGPGIRGFAAELDEGVIPVRSGASRPLRAFREFLERSAPADIEDAYARAFDFEPSTCLYVGYHLFGDTSRRGLFLVKLKGCYGREGFDAGRELPDHLSVLLRFFDTKPIFEERRELIDDCLVPAVAGIWDRLTAARHPYAPLFEALLKYFDEDSHGESTGDRR